MLIDKQLLLSDIFPIRLRLLGLAAVVCAGGFSNAEAARPDEVGNLRLWLAAWDINADGNLADNPGNTKRVPIWDDLSGANNDAYTYHDGLAPVLRENAVNGRPALSFRKNYHMKIRDRLVSPERGATLFMVCRAEVAPGRNLFSVNAATQEHTGAGWFLTTNICVKARERTITFDRNLPTDKFTILCIRFPHDHIVKNTEAFLDGAALKVKEVTNGEETFSFDLKSEYCGLGGVQHYSHHGEIAEMIFYDRALSDDEMDSVGAWLAGVYALESAYPDAQKKPDLTGFQPPSVFALRKVDKEIIASREGHGELDWLGRARIANKDGIWVLVYFQSQGHGTRPLGKTAHIKFSKDEGRTWTAPDRWFDGSGIEGMPLELPRPDSELSEGELLVAPNGDLLLFVNYRTAGRQFGCLQYRSTDSGKSWIAQGLLDNKTELWMPHDSVVADGKIYMGVIVDQGADRKPPLKVALYVSGDNGENWEQRSFPGEAGDGLNESGITLAPDGSLLMVFRTIKERTTKMRRSRDLGKTWEPLVDITYGVGVVQQPHLDVFPDAPRRIYLFGRDRFEEHSQRNGLWFSDDSGKTWDNIDLDAEVWNDSGYGNSVKKANGDLYYVGYLGTDHECDTWGYTVTVAPRK